MQTPGNNLHDLRDQRFVMRRMERALLGGDMCAVPARPQALLAGSLVTILTLAGCVVLAFLWPQPDVGDARIVMGRQTGALYVRVGDTWHPVLNLASARLVAATDADPRPVRESDIGRMTRGPLLGIPGAPQLLGAALSDTSTWSVCDTAGAAPATTVLAAEITGDGPPAAGPARPDSGPILLRSGSQAETTAYLVHKGRRMVVNLDDPVMAGVLRWDGVPPRRVSAWLLNAIPEVSANPDLLDRTVPVGDTAALCVTWTRLPGGETGLIVSAGAGLPLPAGQAPVALAQADGDGPALDGVYLPPGRCAYLRAAAVAGPADGARYLVTGTGVRFTVGDDDAARSLGLPAVPASVPWPVLAGLPAGPQLSRQNALVARDVVDAGHTGPP
ncbi:MAG TPA: type VII secretion protein EccB [Mycobacterium sp.]|nr:type VII secretion protein EccB [Mycobacterium sp.]